MATVKIVLRRKENKDGAFPLAVRITQDRKTSFIHLGKHVKEAEWDADKERVRKTHPNSVRLNNFLASKYAEALDKSLEVETQKDAVTAKAVKRKIKPAGGSTFFAQAALYINNLRVSGKYNRVVSEEPRLKYFKEFLNGQDIAFQEINVALLNRFKAYLKGNRKASERTIMNYLILIRTIYNQAIEAKIADRNNYPFGKGKIVIRFPDSLKVGLTAEEVEAIENIDLKDFPKLQHARNVWLFSLYFAGVRAGNVLSLMWKDFHNGRLYYSMNKSDKGDSLKLPQKAKDILKLYPKKTKHDLVFPELTVIDDFTDLYAVQRKTSYSVKTLDKHLKLFAGKLGLTKPLTMHIARHTFGNLSGDRIPLQMLQKLYRHSSITTTIGYQANFIPKDADDALETVLSRPTIKVAKGKLTDSGTGRGKASNSND